MSSFLVIPGEIPTEGALQFEPKSFTLVPKVRLEEGALVVRRFTVCSSLLLYMMRKERMSYLQVKYDC